MNKDLISDAIHLENAGEFDKAFICFNEAAANNDPYAMTALARFYYSGLSVKRDVIQSIFWDKKAFELGYSMAAFNLGITYKNLGKIDLAEFYFKESLNKKDGSAALELARIYLIQNRLDKAIKCFEDVVNHVFEVGDDELSEAKNILCALKTYYS